MSRYSILLLSLCLLASSSCVRAGFTQRRSPGGGDGPAGDGALDLPLDGGDGPAWDGALDLPLDLPFDATAPQPSCKAPAVVGSSQATMEDAALRANSLELVASSGTGSPTWYATTRGAVDQPFGIWVAIAPHFNEKPLQDLTFFMHKGVERAIMSLGTTSAGRYLQVCAVPTKTSCTAFPVKDTASGQVVSLDMDGPSVAVTATGLLMAHNVDAGKGGDIYLAAPIDPADLTNGWTTAAVPGLAKPGYVEDDPALSPDGLVLVFAGQTSPSADFDIWYSARATTTGAFSTPTRLGAVNSSSREGGPYLAEVKIKGATLLELYFSSTRNGGQSRIYRAECSY